MTSFLHKSTENEDKLDVSDEVATTKLFARKQPTSQNKRLQTSPSPVKLLLKQKATTSLLYPNQPLTQHIPNMPRDGSGAGDNAIEAGHNIVHGDAGGVSLDRCFHLTTI